jgi:hypothetical protein
MATTNDEYKLPVTRPQGGTLDDTTRPDGLGKTSEDQTSTSRQPINIPAGFPRKRK